MSRRRQDELNEPLKEPGQPPSGINPPGEGGHKISFGESSTNVRHPYKKPRSDCTALVDGTLNHAISRFTRVGTRL